jgi:hypothetical protein
MSLTLEIIFISFFKRMENARGQGLRAESIIYERFPLLKKKNIQGRLPVVLGEQNTGRRVCNISGSRQLPSRQSRCRDAAKFLRVSMATHNVHSAGIAKLGATQPIIPSYLFRRRSRRQAWSVDLPTILCFHFQHLGLR